MSTLLAPNLGVERESTPDKSVKTFNAIALAVTAFVSPTSAEGHEAWRRESTLNSSETAHHSFADPSHYGKPPAVMYLVAAAQALRDSLPSDNGNLSSQHSLRSLLSDASEDLGNKYKQIDQLVTMGHTADFPDLLRNPGQIPTPVLAHLAKQLLRTKGAEVVPELVSVICDKEIELTARLSYADQLNLAFKNRLITPSHDVAQSLSRIVRNEEFPEVKRAHALSDMLSQSSEHFVKEFFWALDKAPYLLPIAEGVMKALPHSRDPSIHRFLAETAMKGDVARLPGDVRGVLDIACADPTFISNLTQYWRSLKIAPEYCDLLNRAQKEGIQYPFRFAAADLPQILDNRLSTLAEARLDNRPLVLCVLPKDPAKGTMVGFAEATGELLKKTRLIVIEADSAEDLAKQTRLYRDSQGRSFEALVLNGHGDGANVALGTFDQLDVAAGLKDPAKTVDLTDEAYLKGDFRDCFSSRPNILILSCYGQKGGPKADNVHAMMQRIFKRGSIASSPDSFEFARLRFNNRGIPESFERH
jgi:hypothetical protein